MAKKGETKIDTNRNLCDSCKHNYPDCDGDPEFGNNIDNDNVIRCASYYKHVVFDTKRLEIGETYYVMVFKNKYNKEAGFEIKPRVESKNYYDNLYYDIRNYYHTPEDCQKGIDKILNKK